MQEVRRVDGAANRTRAPSRGRRALLAVPALLFRCQGDPQSTGNCHAEVELILPDTLQTTRPTKHPRIAQPGAQAYRPILKSEALAVSNFRDPAYPKSATAALLPARHNQHIRHFDDSITHRGVDARGIVA
jgi:hypothetical protein